ncbi:MAG: PilZ domain-containing protein [Deltaproteobacteria bacterium]|nr:PilZ domain-containing protein [Deltaproteobacteria bacterium]
MALRKSLLVIEGGGDPLEPIARRLAALEFHVVRAKTPRDATEVLRDPRFLLGAAVIPVDLPAQDLSSVQQAIRAGGRMGMLPMLACGMRPDPNLRERLRRAGVDHALWFPIDDHLMRFQANRALAGSLPVRMERKAERVPTNWPVNFRSNGRERPAKLYSLSASGAFVATTQPSQPRTLVHLGLPLPGDDVRVAAEVVMTNVPGNLARGNLPTGMGVRFRGVDDRTEAALLAYTLERSRVLKV